MKDFHNYCLIFKRIVRNRYITDKEAEALGRLKFFMCLHTTNKEDITISHRVVKIH